MNWLVNDLISIWTKRPIFYFFWSLRGVRQVADAEAISLNHIKRRDCFAPLAMTVSLKICQFRSGTNSLELAGFGFHLWLQMLAKMILGILTNAYFRNFLRLVLLLVSFCQGGSGDFCLRSNQFL